jgi:hypothetical protein
MDKEPKYQFVDEMIGHDTCPIKIMSGKYAGIVFKYGKITLEEIENENLKVNMDVDIVQAPEGFNQQETDFTNTVGEIFVDIVEKNTFDAVKKESADLEDDVHQD